MIERLAGFEAAIASAQRADRRARRAIAVDAPAPAQDRGSIGSTSRCRTASRWSPPTASRSRRATRCWSPARRARASRRCSARSPASGRSARARSRCRAGAKAMTLPQRPYLPIGTLAAAVSYPAVAGTFDAARIRELLVAVGLPALAERLDEDAHWNRMLSLGEQQRIGIARAILHAPDFPVPRRGDRLARRAGRGRALPIAARAAAGHDDRVDRPPLDACGVPQAAA